MRAPKLNRKFTLEAVSAAPDGSGGFVETWASLGTVWAELKGSSGRDQDIDEAALSRANFRITLRAAPAGASERPLPGQRFREGSRIFPILAVVDHDPDGRWLSCVVREEAVR
ncbi:MAG: head-tail adaptor protein [Pseudomonadota bacterium]